MRARKIYTSFIRYIELKIVLERLYPQVSRSSTKLFIQTCTDTSSFWPSRAIAVDECNSDIMRNQHFIYRAVEMHELLRAISSSKIAACPREWSGW